MGLSLIHSRDDEFVLDRQEQPEVPSPTVTIDPTETPLPVEQETPLRVCMQQTGQTRLRCRLDILRSNGQQ